MPIIYFALIINHTKFVLTMDISVTHSDRKSYFDIRKQEYIPYYMNIKGCSRIK